MIKVAGFPIQDLAFRLLEGLKVHGVIGAPELYPVSDTSEPELTDEEWQKHWPDIEEEVLNSLKVTERSAELWQNTREEVEPPATQGDQVWQSMWGPWEVPGELPKGARLASRFGNEEDDKLRACDDYKRNGFNKS